MKIDGPTPLLAGAQALHAKLTAAVRTPPGDLPVLNIGEELPLKVVSVGPGAATVQLKGVNVTIDALPVLKPGMAVLAKVVALVPQPQLEVLTTSGRPGPPAGSGGPELPTASASPPTVARDAAPAGGARPATPAPLALLPPLTPGQTFPARVVDRLPDGRVLLDLHGTPVEAEAPPDLPAGARLTVRVAHAGADRVMLDILPPAHEVEAQAAALLRTQLAEAAPPAGESLRQVQHALARLAELQSRGPPSPGLAKLQTLLQSLLPGRAPATPEQLADYVRDGGLQYEAKLVQASAEGPAAMREIAAKDVKGLLLQALQEAETTSPERPQAVSRAIISYLDSPPPAGGAARAEAPTLVQTLANHLNHIETQQALNLLAQLRGEPFQLQVPFLTGRGLSTATLAVERDRRHGSGGGRDEDGYNALLLLDLDEFGQTRIDAHFTERSVRAIFYVERDTAVELLRAEMPAFQKTLEGLGFREVLLGARPLRQLPPDRGERFASLAAGVPATVSLVDVRA
jgi:hypothetical protein